MLTMLPFRAEYSYRQILCSVCIKYIKHEELRIGIVQQELTKDCMQPKWCHKSCFFTIRRPLSLGAIDGFANLRYDDQMEIMKRLDACNENGTHTISADQSDPHDSAAETQIKEQQAEFFTVFDKVKRLHHHENVALLTAFNQFVPENQAEVLTHLTDIMCFGGLSPCPICKYGQLIFRNTGYVCMGYDSPWSKCIYSVKVPNRVPVTLPPQHHELLGSQIKPRTRIVRNIAAFNDEDFELFAKQPLFGMEFLFIGETKKPKDVLEDKIRKMGGTIGTKVHKRLTAVISNEREVNKPGSITRDASIHRIQVIPEDFIDEVLDKDPIEVIAAKDLTKWGEDPHERVPERKKFKPMEHVIKSLTPNVNSWAWKCGDFEGDHEIPASEGKIYENGGLRYSVMLNFVDIITNKNSYCKLQLVTHTSSQSTSSKLLGYRIVQCEGRIGTSIGLTRSRAITDLETACNEFEKVFLEKTGNHFTASTENFVKQPGKYYRVDIDNDILSRKMPKISVPSKLAEPLYQLMELLFIEKVMKSTLFEYCIDLDRFPLGLIHRRSILGAIATLEKIPLMLRSSSPDSSEIIRASNQFYSIFPNVLGLQPVRPINTNELVEEKIKMVRNILEKLDKFDILTSELNQEKNLLDVCYEQLEDSAEIKMLNKSSGMYTQITNFVNNTQVHSTEQYAGLNRGRHYSGNCEVDGIFEVTRHEELMRYEPYEKNFNRQLLFHGSSIVNFVGILTNGLKITPPEAYFNGSAFGKGIYFSDSVSKAAGYCQAEKGTGLVLLCEVAAGLSDIRYRYDNKPLISYCESVQAIGQFYPHPLHVRPDGLKIPNGNLIRRQEQTGNVYNEFVLFDESRVKIRYLVKLRFKK